MTVAFIGTVLTINLSDAEVRDDLTKKNLLCKIAPDDLNDIQVGSQAAFVGDLQVISSDAGKNLVEITIKRIVLRRFLDPMYEEDVITAYGDFALLVPINDPFHEAYRIFKAEEDKRLEELASVEEEKEADSNEEFIDDSSD